MPSHIVRFVRHTLVGCSALLAVAVGFSWVRSYWRCDEIGYYTYKPAPPGQGQDRPNIVGSNRGGFYWLSMEADITCEVDWYGGEPTEVITSSAAEPRLASAALGPVMGSFAFVPRWERGGFRLEARTVLLPFAVPMTPATVPAIPAGPGGWYRGVVVPHWAVMAVLACAPAMRLRRLCIRHRRRRKGLCLTCGYDLRASGEICPECGQARTREQGRGRRLPLRKAVLAVGIILVLTAVVACIALQRERTPRPVRLERGTTLPAGQLPRYVELDLGNGVTMRFALIPAGRFLMGSPSREPGRRINEVQREVVISRPFYIGITPVTQAQWRAVMGDSPSEFKGDDLPVDSVPWNDSVAFCVKLSERCGHRVGLPTEAQWECACRAGTITPFNTGRTLQRDRANYGVGSSYPANRAGRMQDRTVPVGSFRPNAWGLYDMHGNVWEWCADWYDPTGASSGSSRVLRGGSWSDDPQDCRSARRGWSVPGTRALNIGFRVALDSP